MKDKHIESYIRQCQIIAQLSPCVRRKYGAIAVDPEHNVIITSGYNGTPRGSNMPLCGGNFCKRDGIKDTDKVEVIDRGLWGVEVVLQNEHGCQRLARHAVDHNELYDSEELRRQAYAKHPPIASGTMYEVGCHHAEQNVVANAARLGRSLAGATLFCTGVPCLGCARTIHHAGVALVYVIRGGYADNTGLQYLTSVGLRIVEVAPPPNLRGDIEEFVEETRREDLSGENLAEHILLSLEEILEQHPYEGSAIDKRKK